MIKWPNNKKFAFTVIDDTDCSTLSNAPIVYNYLSQLGFKTTKSVWIFDGETREDNKSIIGTTCEDENYLKWVKSLKKEGFEIALHSTSWSSSKREKIIKGLDQYKLYFGEDPNILVQHNDSKDCESLYWGENRVTGFYRFIYKLIMKIKKNKRDIYFGEKKDSNYFWGDLCKERIKYVRNFVYPEINTLKVCPYMPYHDQLRPYVKYWFASTEAPDVNSFNKCLSIENQNKLEVEGGACIIYTHFGNDFVSKGVLNSDFTKLMENLSAKNGWFVPASKLLDYIIENKNNKNISKNERDRLERKWLFHKLNIGTS